IFQRLEEVFASKNGKAAYKLDLLMKYKTQYVGDNSKVVALIDTLPLPQGITRSTVELRTSETPYGMTIHYDLENDSVQISEEQFFRNSVLLFALIDNVEKVEHIGYWNNKLLSSMPIGFEYTRADAERIVGGDVRQFAENKEKLAELIEVITASSQPAETIGWEPTTYKTVNNFDGVTMTVKEGTASSTSLTVTFENNSSSQCIYGEYFWLEKKINGSWYQVPVVIDGNYGFNDIGYDLASGDDSEWAVDWNWLYGSLDTGEYRIVKNIADFRGTGDYDTYYLAAEFTIY
ncbi:MAG: DUF4825 domain-containing protein, partial [Desulfitobacteriaceae bacterium]|nr:DUF4825 domain-containing protein [Desulfitobacteriaceae bacterium]